MGYYPQQPQPYPQQQAYPPPQQYPQPVYGPAAYPPQPVYGQYPYPPQPVYGPMPYPQRPPMKPRHVGLIIAVVVIVVVVVVVAIIAAVYFMGSPLIGKWNIQYIESGTGSRTDYPSGTYIEFKAGGSGVISASVTGVSASMDFKWKDLGGGKVEMTMSYGGMSATQEMSYTISGSTLRLTSTSSSSYGSYSSTLVCQRA